MQALTVCNQSVPDAASLIIQLYQVLGSDDHPRDGVSESEHALQAATLAQQEGAPASLIVAALVHDIGRLLRQLHHRGVTPGYRHEQLGARWLAWFYGPEITEPVRLHVDAKRYLCAVQRDYLEGLSPNAARDLEEQGGPLSRKEVRDFHASPYHVAAVWLRRFDERAIDPGAVTPGFEHYRTLLEETALARRLDFSQAFASSALAAPAGVALPLALPLA
jgi:gamma-butyrobetaine dioxygenase